MKRVLMSVLALAVFAAPAFAQDKKAAAKELSASGSVSKVSDSSLTVKGKDAGKDAEWTFTVDKDTKVTATGASRKTAAAKADNMSTPITTFVHVGDVVSVKYHDMGATKHAASVTVTAQVPEKQTLQISFSHTSWSMSSKHLTLKPPDRHTSAIFSRRALTGPANSPSRTSSQPLW